MNPDLTKEQVLQNLSNVGYKVPSQDGTNPITADSLAPESPLVVPEKPVATASSGLSERAVSYATSAQSQSQAEIDRLQKEKEAGASDIASLVESIGGQASDKVKAYEDTGLLESKKSIDKIRSDMEAKNLATRRQIEQITNSNPTGMVGAGAQGEITRLERENASYQADQAITLSALNRDFETAKSFIDAKIDAETEGLKAQLEAKKFFYQENKDSFTKAEDRQYKAMLTADERAYNEERDSKKVLEDLRVEAMKNASEQNAPDSIITAIASAKTPDEVLRKSGTYGISLKAKLETEKLQKEILQIGAPTATERKAQLEDLKKAETAGPVLENKITLIDAVLNSNAMDSVVGPSFLGRAPTTFGGNFRSIVSGVGIPTVIGGIKDALTGERQNFIAGVEQLVDQEFLDKLIDVKAQGATFGALSNAEGQALRSAATKIGTWRIRESDDPASKVVGYNASEASFRQEFQIIRELTRKAYQVATGNAFLPDEQAQIDAQFQSENANTSPESYYTDN